MTEVQWAGQDKRDTVAAEVPYWVELVKDSVKCGREGSVHCNGSHVFHKFREFNKNSRPTTTLSSAFVLVKAASPPSNAVSHNSLSGSRLTGIMN